MSAADAVKEEKGMSKELEHNFILNKYVAGRCDLSKEVFLNYIKEGILPPNVNKQSYDLQRCVQPFELTLTERLAKKVLKDDWRKMERSNLKRNCTDGFSYKSGMEGYSEVGALCDTDNFICKTFKGDDNEERRCVMGANVVMNDGNRIKVPAWKMSLCDMGAESFDGQLCPAFAREKERSP